MLTNPEFFVLDEPVNGLDPKGITENRVNVSAGVERGKTLGNGEQSDVRGAGKKSH